MRQGSKQKAGELSVREEGDDVMWPNDVASWLASFVVDRVKQGTNFDVGVKTSFLSGGGQRPHQIIKNDKDKDTKTYTHILLLSL